MLGWQGGVPGWLPSSEARRQSSGGGLLDKMRTWVCMCCHLENHDHAASAQDEATAFEHTCHESCALHVVKACTTASLA